MSHWQLIFDGLRFHWRSHLALMLGVVAGTAVLTGALLVGDSMRGSLRHLALDRLGRIDEVLVSNRFFRAKLADELTDRLTADESAAGHDSDVVPAILLQGTIERPPQAGSPGDTRRRAGGVHVIGAAEAFSRLGHGGPASIPRADEIVINQALADEIGARVGDELILRIGQASEIPPDSPLGRKHETVRSQRLKLAEIVPQQGLGQFALHPTQQRPLNAFVPLGVLQAMLDVPDRVNALLVAGIDAIAPTQEEASRQLHDALRPTLDDYGLKVMRTERGYGQVTSERMLLEPAVESAALRAFGDQDAQVAITYLANTLAAGGREIPYSTITAVDFAEQPPLGPLLSTDGEPIGPLGEDGIVLNQWAADDLQVEPGAMVTVKYFLPESTHGRVEETSVTLRLKAIAALEGAAADRELTPELKGVTDQLTMADWDPPFPFAAGRIRREDENYWEDHGTTPKAFVSLATGQRLWGSRFGEATSVRFRPAEPEVDEARLAEQLDRDAAALGFAFRPVRRMALAAATGTTPFSLLFLGFSMFIIAAAVMLILLLFRLGVERRAAEVGILAAVGLARDAVRRLFAWEGLLVAALGSLVGVIVGVGYAWLMIVGLSTWWVEAIVTPFLALHVTPLSLLLGFVAGVLVAWGAIVLALWQLRRVEVRRLLAGRADDELGPASAHAAWSRGIGYSALVVAAVLAILSVRFGGEQQAGLFFGSGALVLVGCLSLVWARLKQGAIRSLVAPGRGGLTRLALRNGARHPGRSALSIGLVAAASFLIVAISAFRLEPPSAYTDRQSGTGGFALLATADQPIYFDLNTPAGRIDVGLSDEDDAILASAETISLRVRPGDDASCLNLYQPQSPRILGVPPAMIERGGFAWAATTAETPDERDNPWLLLDKALDPRGDSPPIPVVIDQNTALYSLHLSGVGERFELDDGRGGKLHFEVVGLLRNSILQGDLLISETNFRSHFPDISGYRMFLVAAQPEDVEQVRSTLETALGDWGLDAQRTDVRLAGFFAVQNTYLSTFQSLGGLGLLLGTFGLAVVELRNVLERRGELALLRATGFRRARLAWLVLLENAALLIGGLAIGVLAALVAVVPHWLLGAAQIPWLSLAGTLLLVLTAGLLSAALAVRAALRAELLPALRGD